MPSNDTSAVPGLAEVTNIHSQPLRFKRSAFRSRGRTANWRSEPTTTATRSDGLRFQRWQRHVTGAADPLAPKSQFSKYNIQAEAPSYDDETYDQHLTSPDWSKAETDHLLLLYREYDGKWPVIVDRYESETTRTMEDLKSRFYSVSATMLAINTPTTSMTASEFSLYELLSNFNPRQETSRKMLAEGHLYRRQNEVDEETVLLGELQRIMLNQATLDGEREVSWDFIVY